jgi:fumarate reductase flavoprotein subunit
VLSCRRYYIVSACLILFGLLSSAEDKKPTTAEVHGKNGVFCADCHGTATPKQPATGESCVKCHTSYKEVATTTTAYTPNPHDNHYVNSTEPDCTECHQGHKAQRTVCVDCHADMQFTRRP